MLEDTKFMSFVDGIPDAVLPEKPYVFHRLVPSESRWRGEISDMLSQLDKLLTH